MTEQAPRSTPSPAPDLNGPAAVATLTYLGFTLQLLQAGVVPLLPIMGKQLHITIGAASWLVTSSLLAGAVALAVISRLADLYGKRRMILVSLILVLVGCLICSVTNDYAVLIIGRVLMGAQLPMLALPEAIASDTMPPRRAGLTIGAIHSGTGVGIAGGILLGALVGVHPAAWHWFFYIGTAITVLGIATTVAFVRDSPARARGGLDVTGAVLLSAALVALLLGLSQGPVWGWASPSVLALLIGGLALTGVWLAQASRATFPLIRVADLLRPSVRVPYAMTFLVAFGVYGSLSAVTRFAQTPPAVAGYGFGFGILTTAWLAVPQAVGAVVGVVVIRAFAPRRSLVYVVVLGLLLNAVAFAGFAALHGSAPLMFSAQGVYSAGTAIALAVTQIIVVRVVPASESGIALGLTIVMYAVGNSLGSDVVGVLFTGMTSPNGLPTLGAYITSFVLGGVATLLAAALGITLVRGRAAAAQHPMEAPG
ncbi:MAG TPA: MFS transporter [Streptosporangiaceae bacterium]|jgi:predicted MFS family arabinose efflux permease